MAKKQIGYGSTGAEVKELQQTLNSKLPGYNLAVDGIFGNATKKAVQDFQKQNKLAVDGIVGNNTWAALLGNTTTKAPASTNTAAQSPTTKAPTAPTYQAYTQSDWVKQSAANRETVNASKPEKFTHPNLAISQDVIDEYMNRKDFSYDLNGDALYQQYKDKYIQQGKMAMQDTMGQAAAMTGGYGNSYAATVGNQAYQASLENLNDIVPQLYQMAYDRYNQEGQDMLNKYNLLSDSVDRAYGMHRNDVSDWKDELNRADSEYWNTLGMDYSMYENKQNHDVNAYQTALDNYWQNKAYDYQVAQDAIANKLEQDKFDLTKRQYEDTVAKSNSSGNVIKGEDGGTYVKDEEGNLTPVGAVSASVSDAIRSKAQSFESNTALANYLDGLAGAGSITEAQADQLYAEYMDGNEKDKLSDMVGNIAGWKVIDNGGVNWWWGIDGNAIVKAPDGQQYRLDNLVDKLVGEGMTKKDAKKKVQYLQDTLGGIR